MSVPYPLKLKTASLVFSLQVRWEQYNTHLMSLTTFGNTQDLKQCL